MNGGINKEKKEYQMDLQNRNTISLRDILKEAGRLFNVKDKHKGAKLYNKSGLQILDDDVQFMKH